MHIEKTIIILREEYLIYKYNFTLKPASITEAKPVYFLLQWINIIDFGLGL